MAFYEHPTTFNDDLIKAANNINAHAPIIIDSMIRFDRVDAVHGNTFEYNYTLLTLDKSEVDTIQLKTSGRQLMIEQIKKNPQSSLFRNNGVVIQSKYVDKKGMYVATVTINPNEY